MPNNKYRRGAALENQVKHILEERGFIATRSAGSHGEYDVWAFNGKTLMLIQCKIGASAKRVEKLLEALEKSMLKKLPEICGVVCLFVCTAVNRGKVQGKGKMLLPRMRSNETQAGETEGTERAAH